MRRGGGQERDKTKPRKLVDEAKIGGLPVEVWRSTRIPRRVTWKPQAGEVEVVEASAECQFRGEEVEIKCGWSVGFVWRTHCHSGPWQRWQGNTRRGLQIRGMEPSPAN